jgi:hypothetical protein
MKVIEKETIDNLKTGGLKDEDLVKIIDPPVVRPELHQWN